MKITIEHLCKYYPSDDKNSSETKAVDDLSIDIKNGELVGLLGPSGCGKSTTLYMIAGLKEPTSGQIYFDDEDITSLEAEKRGIGLVFQNYALYPHMTVYKNIAFPLTNLKAEEAVYDAEAREYSKIIAILGNPGNIISTIKSSSLNSKIRKDSAIRYLSAEYDIPASLASLLFSFNLHAVSNVDKKAEELKEKYIDKLRKREEQLKSKGVKYDSEYCLLNSEGRRIIQKKSLSKDEIDLMVRRVARVVQIDEYLDRKPAELSGGQQQRVAIARALVKRPGVLLLDEPLSNLDARLRLQTRDEIRRIQKAIGIPCVFVTHDQEEAMSICDRIVVMKDGKAQQIGTPSDVYSNPKKLFVAKFLGNPPIAVFEGRIDNNALYIGEEKIMDVSFEGFKEVYVGIRPEGFMYLNSILFDELEERKTGITLHVDSFYSNGREVSLQCSHPAFVGEKLKLTIDADNEPSQGDVFFSVRKSKIYVFSRVDEERIEI